MMTARQLGRVVGGMGRPVLAESPQCGATVRRTLAPFRLKGQLFGFLLAEVCGNRHEWFPEESGAAIEAIAKARGLWGIDARGKPRPAGRPEASTTRRRKRAA